MYPDDSQLYIIMRQSNEYRATALQDLTLCIQDIMSWNVSNMLKCNPKKIEIIHSPRLFHRPNQFLLSRLEIVQEFLWVMKSETLLSHLTAISLLKLTSTTFVAPPQVLFVTSEQIRNLLFRSTTERLIHPFVSGLLQQYSSRPTLLQGRETTTVAKYSRKANY